MSSPDPNAPIDPGSDQAPDPAGTHDLDNTVIAVLDDAPAVRDAIEGLTEAGSTSRSCVESLDASISTRQARKVG